jgi:hypothetical protein
MLVQRCFNLELAVEIVFGQIDGDAPADFAVEVEPRFLDGVAGAVLRVQRHGSDRPMLTKGRKKE